MHKLTNQIFLPLAVVARKLQHAASTFFIILLVPGLNLSERFHCAPVIGPLASSVSLCRSRETPCQILSRHDWNQDSHRLDQNSTFSPETAQAWGLGHREAISMFPSSKYSNVSAAGAGSKKNLLVCT
jgi:hypothetical protein